MNDGAGPAASLDAPPIPTATAAAAVENGRQEGPVAPLPRVSAAAAAAAVAAAPIRPPPTPVAEPRRSGRKRRKTERLERAEATTAAAATAAATKEAVHAWATGGPSVPSQPPKPKRRRRSTGSAAAAASPAPPTVSPAEILMNTPVPAYEPAPPQLPPAGLTPTGPSLGAGHTASSGGSGGNTGSGAAGDGGANWAAVRLSEPPSPSGKGAAEAAVGPMARLEEAAGIERSLQHLTKSQKLDELETERRHLREIRGVLMQQLHGLGFEGIALDRTLHARIAAFAATPEGAAAGVGVGGPSAPPHAHQASPARAPGPMLPFEVMPVPPTAVASAVFTDDLCPLGPMEPPPQGSSAHVTATHAPGAAAAEAAATGVGEARSEGGEAEVDDDMEGLGEIIALAASQPELSPHKARARKTDGNDTDDSDEQLLLNFREFAQP